MTRRLITRVSRRGDEGAALLLALVFIGVVGVMITALLPYAQSGISEASVARDVRSLQNAADGAVEGAIGQARPIPLLPDGTAPCPDYVSNIIPGGTAPTYTTTVGTTTTNTPVKVTCTLQPGNFSGNPDVPPYAIVTTAGDVNASGGNTLSVDGGMYVDGNITTNGSSGTKYLVTGGAYITNPGSGAGQHNCLSPPPGSHLVVTAIPGPPCPASPPAYPDINYPSVLGTDAGAAQALIDSMPKDPVGKCPAGAGYVQFKPGFYSQFPTPDPASCGKTPPKTYWFAPCANTPCTGQTAPGLYYLDFPRVQKYDNYSFTGNTYPTWSCCSSGAPGPGFWDLDKPNITLIGGTLAPSWSSKLPGHRCLSNDTDPGVQILLGGTSEISTGNSSELELCASKTSSSSPQRIAIYSLSSNTSWAHNPFGLDTSPRPQITGTDMPAKAWQDTAGDSAWTNEVGAEAPVATDPTNGTATATFTGSQTYGVDLSGYDLPPDGSLIADAVVHVTHFEAPTPLTGTMTPQLLVHYADGSTDKCTVQNVSGSTLGTTTTDLMKDCTPSGGGAGAVATLSKPDFRWMLLHHLSTGSGDPEKKISITYEVVGNSASKTVPLAGTAAVDAVQLDISYVKPALDQNTCQDTVTSCYSYSNSNSAAADNTFFIGSVYTPELPMNVVVHNEPNTIFQRGVIVSALTVNVSASSKQTDAPFSLPHTQARDRIGIFTATTTADNKVRLVAKVEFIDCKPAPQCASSSTNLNVNQVYYGREVDILKWTVYH